MCRSCALINVHYRPETYHQGVSCPQCRALSPGVLQNTHTVREIEDLLLQSARQYVTNRLLTFRDKSIPENERQNCIQMIKMYHAVGYEGNVHILNEKERDAASLNRLKLEVAKLEECRLNSCGIIDSYRIRCDMNIQVRSNTRTTVSTNAGTNGGSTSLNSNSDIQTSEPSKAGKFPISFLHALKVCKNTFFEHYYLHNPTTSATDAVSLTAKLADCQAKCAALVTSLRDVVYTQSNNHKLDVLDKLVLVCMKIQTTVPNTSTTAASSDITDSTSTASTSTTNDNTTQQNGCTINQLELMLWNYLKHPDLQFHTYFNSANSKSEFMSVVYKRVTPQAVQTCVNKLVLNNFVSLVIKDLTLYQVIILLYILFLFTVAIKCSS